MASARHPQRSGWFSSVLSTTSLVALMVALVSPTAWGQLPRTRLTSITPPVGQVGVTVEVTVAGADIDEVGVMSFSHKGITAVQKTTESGGKKTPVANTFVVTIAKNVPAGLYDARVTGLFGASNPMTFAVTSREIVRESEGNNGYDEADEFALGKTVYGQINGAADVDYLKFTGKQGQRVVVDCQATRVDSSLHAICEIYSRVDGRVRQLSFARRQVGHDPVTDVTLPADGEYFVKIYDERFAGSVAHTYLLTAHTGPHIDFVKPAAGVPGTTGTFTLYGRNLPGGQPAGLMLDRRELQKLVVKIAVPKSTTDLSLSGIRVEPVSAGLDAFEYALKADNGVSNSVPIYFATGTMGVEVEPNNTAEKAQKIQVPGDGLPIVLLADRQTTGGYPKIGCVISADLPTLARLRPGNKIRFALSTLEQAAKARRDRDNWFARFCTQIKQTGASGIIDPTALQTLNLVSGVVGPDSPTDPGR